MQRSVRGVVVDIAAISDPGRDPAKQVNEDSAAYSATPNGHLVVVCDGMGGHTGGREASQAAVRAIVSNVESTPPGVPTGALLKSSIEIAGRAVYGVGGAQPTEVRPGSTCVALIVSETGVDVAHVGDSRAYMIRDSEIHRLTRDHSMVQQMVDAGVLSPEDAAAHPEANKITRALGMQPEVEVELARGPRPLHMGNLLLLASDGLTDLVPDRDILATVLERIAGGTELACQALVALANERGGHDNITVQLVRIVEMPARIDDAATLVDTQTVIDEAPGTEPFRPPTVVEPHKPHPAPTLLDEPARLERTTEPGVAATARPPPPLANVAGQPGRHLVVGAAAIAVLIVVAVVGWWLYGALKHRGEEGEVPPPPEPTRSAAPWAGPAWPRHHRHRDGTGGHDDAGPDDDDAGGD